MIEGLSHITLIVVNLERSAKIIVEVLGGKELYDSAVKNFSLSREKFFDVNGIWLVLMEGKPLSERTYTHIAFKVSEAELDRAGRIINSLGLEVKPPRSRVSGEGRSLYFYDYDNHLFELHTGTLQERLKRYAAC